MSTKVEKICSNDLRYRNGVLNSVYIYFKENLGILIGLLSMVILSVLSPAFANRKYSHVLSRYQPMQLGIGMTFAIIITGIDLLLDQFCSFRDRSSRSYCKKWITPLVVQLVSLWVHS